MKLLVLATDYPDNSGKVSLMYIHTRNLAYRAKGYAVTVLNFSSKENYSIDGISVITLESYQTDKPDADILLCHAANIRNHYRFLKKYQKRFGTIIFFYHGHEVLKINKVYSKPYSYVHQNICKNILQNIYDTLKLFLWRHYLPKLMKKSKLIFVSNWMKNEFEKWCFPLTKYQERVFVTYNCISKEFETLQYDKNGEKKYDFITIRSFLDGSKYAVDLVISLAKKYPNYIFCVVGKGNIFDYYGKPDNIVWLNQYMDHNEIVQILNQSRCALMPTRTDAQGLMACEIASFGIPLITSNIPVCHEVFDTFKNVGYINNEGNWDDFEEVYHNLSPSLEKNDKYFEENTVKYEIEIFKKEV